MNNDQKWHQNTIDTIDGYHRMIVASVAQLDDEQLHRRIAPGFNSVATLLRHLGGNLLSRWTHFLEEDGEKPDRNRDQEFMDWEGDRDQLLGYFESGWQKFRDAIVELRASDFEKDVKIRGEAHSVQNAILRSITHVSYHVGQIVLIARWVYGNDESWRWMTIQPGQSQQFNQSTWGTPAARGIAGKTE